MSPKPEGVGLDVGRDDGQRAEHDAEVLGDVAEVLDRPLGVVAERRVAVRLELVLVVVARVQPRAGGELRVQEERRHRDDAADRRRHEAARAGPAAAHEDEERRGEHERQARRRRDAEQEPGQDLRAVERPDRRPPPAGLVVGPFAAAAPSARSSRTSSASARGSWRSATPTASRAAITATRWARYHVLPTAAAHHQTVPVANRIVVSARTASRIRRPPSIQHATPTPIAARAAAIASWSTVSPTAATNGSRTSAGRGGNGSRT